MGLSDLVTRIKSALGLHDSQGRQQEQSRAEHEHRAEKNESQEVGVTVEREPSTASEDAVKGTDTDSDDGDVEAAESTGGDEPEAAPESAEDAIDEAEQELEDDEDDTAEAEALGTDESVDVIKGIGAAYAERLGEAGVDTVADLASSDPEALAEETGISEKRIDGWVEKARHR